MSICFRSYVHDQIHDIWMVPGAARADDYFTRLTAAVNRSNPVPTARQFDEPVLLMYDHERGPQAIAEGAQAVADAAGKLFDDLLATPAAVEPAPSSALPQRGAIYFVMVDRFANGDRSNDGAIDPNDPAAFHGGDLQGVIDHLDELKSLGVETIPWPK